MPIARELEGVARFASFCAPYLRSGASARRADPQVAPAILHFIAVLSQAGRLSRKVHSKAQMRCLTGDGDEPIDDSKQAGKAGGRIDGGRGDSIHYGWDAWPGRALRHRESG